MYVIKMVKYSLRDAISKVGRVFSSGRAANYFNRAKGLYEGGKSLYNDAKNDYSNPAMGKRRRRKRSTPKMGRRRRRR